MLFIKPMLFVFSFIYSTQYMLIRTLLLCEQRASTRQSRAHALAVCTDLSARAHGASAPIWLHVYGVYCGLFAGL